MILVCYDGSPEAQAAIEHAGELLNGRQATVLTVWEPFVDVMARSGTAMGLGARSLNYEEIDAANERARSSRAPMCRLARHDLRELSSPPARHT